MSLDIKYSASFKNYGLDTPLRKAHFMAQIEHESNLKPIEENLNYSMDGLCSIFKKYFATKTSTVGYERNPKNIANKVYANRMGNGNEQSGDGWKYRGRGFIQLTGKENYKKLSDFTGIDYITHPDLLIEEPNALICALWFWKNKGLNAFADKDDCKGITLKINGGLNGLDKRLTLVNKYKKQFDYEPK
jgi:putative chitinase